MIQNENNLVIPIMITEFCVYLLASVSFAFNGTMVFLDTHAQGIIAVTAVLTFLANRHLAGRK
jgi:hypothetical protein